ncbi:E3 ubiquitin protein ligase SINAT2-like protein, partial [Tanacetum coccineum]
KKIKEAKREARKKLDKKKQLERDTEENVLDNEGVPSSIHHSHKKLRDSLDGLVISPSMALLFSDGDKKGLNLIVHGRVWME